MRIANSRRYRVWAGNPKGEAEDMSRCVEEVGGFPPGVVGYHQCLRKRGHGPDGLYCRQHAKTAKPDPAPSQEEGG